MARMQIIDNQQLGNTSCFTLQKVVFQTAKDGILECNMASFDKQQHLEWQTSLTLPK